MTDHQRRRSSQPQQPQQKSTPVPVTTGPLSVQILNYEASLLQQQVCQPNSILTSFLLDECLDRSNTRSCHSRAVESITSETSKYRRTK